MKLRKKKTSAENRAQSTRDKTTPSKSRSHQTPAESRRERVRQPAFETPEVSIQEPALPETPKKGQNEIKLQQDLIEDMANSEEKQYHGMEDHDAASTNQTLQQLIQLLTLKAQQEGMSNNEGKLVVENCSKIIPKYDGKNMQVADTYGLNAKQRIEEFHRDKVCGAELHLQLSARTKKTEKSFHEYVLQMKRIAALGEMDTESVIRYVVNGLNLKSVYSCTSFKELREKYDVYEKFQPSKSNDKGASGKSDKKQHCFNCGAADHLRKDCKAEQKCSRCNKSGHMSAQCTSSTNAPSRIAISEEKAGQAYEEAAVTATATVEEALGASGELNGKTELQSKTIDDYDDIESEIMEQLAKKGVVHASGNAVKNQHAKHFGASQQLLELSPSLSC
ncbi:hypothetical protein ACLKA7_012443 [Drosophila subpalustris]